jgi:hypothetical protein
MLLNYLWKYLKTKKLWKQSWFYNANSTGFQFIEDNSKQWTYRVQAKFGYKSPLITTTFMEPEVILPPLLPGLPLMKLIATKMEFVLTNRFSN